MSRAFVKDVEETFDDLPERPISIAPNWVTEKGLADIEAEIARLSDELSKAGDDRYTRAHIGRDLRYWTARRGSAHLMPPPSDTEVVYFGSTVTIDRADGRHEVFRIVGEDEADPSRGTISHVSPMARALLGKGVGEVVKVANAELELVAIA